MDDPDRAKQIVEALYLGFPDHDPDKRPVHTFGVGATGSFTASDVACDYCIAEHFQGGTVRATVRFSNGSGSGTQHDGWSDVRGMATKFHLRNDVTTDLIAMTLGEFFTPTIDTFFDFAEATKPTPVKRESPWRKIGDMLRLIPPVPDPYPGRTTDPTPGAVQFANTHDFAQLPIFQGAMLGAPVSYARASYHAVHTFVIQAPDGARRWVRFTWQPVEGVLNVDPQATPIDDYLREELTKRLQGAPARFLLMMSIGEPGDDFNNSTRPWPPHRVRVVMGTLTLDTVPQDQEQYSEKLSFNPWRLVNGIAPSDDPILHARKDAYEWSRMQRHGACPFSGN